jgi:hypothetical protein
MTKDEWIAEVTAAVAASGLPLTVFTAHVEVNSPMCYAELSGDSTRTLTIARDRYPTPAARSKELLRQLQLRPNRRQP